MALSVAILYVLPFLKFSRFKSHAFNLFIKLRIWVLFSVLFILTWIGARPVEEPYVLIGQITTVRYILIFAVWFI